MRKAITDLFFFSSVMNAFLVFLPFFHTVSVKHANNAIYPTSQPFPFYTTDGNANKEN